jgi:HPt (histidine-containing phosphotransfer) domain-containing protein
MTHSNFHEPGLAAFFVDAGSEMAGAAAAEFDEGILNSFRDYQSPNDPDFVLEIIELYVKEANTRISAIRKSATANDGEELKRAAHALKGSSATLGLIQIAQICESLERITLPDSSNRLDVLVQLLLDKFERARAQLSRILLTPPPDPTRV